MREHIIYDPKRRIFNGNVQAIGFRDGNSEILYIPSLNLSGYGDSVKEAKEMLDQVVGDFVYNILHTMREPEVWDLLRNLGWKKTILPKRLKPLSDTTFEDIAKQFNIPLDTPRQNIAVAV